MGTNCLFGCIMGKLEFNWMHVFISLNKRHNNWNFHLFSPLSSMRENLLNSNCGAIPISTIQDRIIRIVQFICSYYILNTDLYFIKKKFKIHTNQESCIQAMFVGTNEEWMNEGEWDVESQTWLQLDRHRANKPPPTDHSVQQQKKQLVSTSFCPHFIYDMTTQI